MGDYFSAGNPGNSLFIYIATAAGADHILELDISALYDAGGDNWFRLSVADAVSKTFLNAVQPEGVINLGR